MANEEKQKTSVWQFLDNMRLLILMFIDSWRGTYRQLPWWCTVVLVFTLLYALSPLDLIPDAIPFIGVVDDVSLMYLCYKVIEGEIGKYGNWRRRSNTTTEGGHGKNMPWRDINPMAGWQ